MKIPFTEYEFTIPRKLIFTVLSMVLYLLISMPDTYNFVGKFINLEEYDDYTKHDRYYLWGIHSIVFGLLMFILLIIYNPNPTIILTENIIPKN